VSLPALGELILERRMLWVLVITLLAVAHGFAAPPEADFSGTWKQSNERSIPPRRGDVTLNIVQHDRDLTVDTTMASGSSAPRHALQRYTIDGKNSVSTGADGDEFDTSIVWNGPELIFSIEEHEDGRILLSREVWRLIDDGAAIERRRERKQDPGTEQTIIYVRQTTAR
jgi:hypothetical protein